MSEKGKRRREFQNTTGRHKFRSKLPFPYDVYAFMEAVREHPTIWDKSSEAHRDKCRRRLAWDEVCSTFEPDYDNMSDEDKAKMLNLMTGKWANIRDAFIRSITKLKNQRSQYIYYDHLTFLIEPYILQNNSYVQDDTIERLDDDDDDAFSDPLMKTSPSDSPSEELPQWLRSRRTHKPKRSRINAEDETSSVTAEVDEDMAFFQSLLTPVRCLSMAEKMEFRIGVLTILQHFGETAKVEIDDDPNQDQEFN